MRVEKSIVLQLGSRVCRVGKSGECSPRVMIDVAAAAEQVLGKEVDALYSPQQMHARNGKQLQERHRDLVLCLVRILRSAYHEYVTDSLTQTSVV